MNVAIPIIVPISVILSISGFYILTFRSIHTYLIPSLNRLFRTPSNSPLPFLFILGIAWPISNSIRGLFTIWGYYLGAHVQVVSLITGAFGLLFIIIAKDTIRLIFSTRKLKTEFSSFGKSEWTICLIIMTTIICFLYQTAIPWFEHDEMVVYGFLTKLIANGWNFDDILSAWGRTVHYGPKLTESLDAQLFLFGHNSFFIRLSRFGNLILCSISIYAFLRLFNVNRFWSFFSIACFLNLPELGYIGLSLKVDSVVMSYELCALLNLSIAVWGYIEHKNTQTEGFALPFVLIALYLAFSASGSRKSGIYFALIAIIIFLFLIFRAHIKKYHSITNLNLSSIMVFIILSSAGYWINMYYFGNPIFPFKAPWPFDNGEFLFVLDNYREKYNITNLPIVAKQLYLLFYLGLDFERIDKFIKISQYLPFIKYRFASISGPFPYLLSVFILPFFANRKKILCVLSGLFLYQLFAWSNGVHYSRVFLASSSITILISIIIVNMKQNYFSIFLKILQNALKIGLLLSLIGTFSFHLLKTAKIYNSTKPIYTEYQRYEAMCRLIRNRWYKSYNTLHWHKGDYCPKKDTIDSINNILSQLSKPYVGVIASSGRTMHIYFDKGFFMEYDRKDYKKVDLILVNRLFLKSISKELFPDIWKRFPVSLYESKNKNWILIGKKDL